MQDLSKTPSYFSFFKPYIAVILIIILIAITGTMHHKAEAAVTIDNSGRFKIHGFANVGPYGITATCDIGNGAMIYYAKGGNGNAALAVLANGCNKK